MDYNRENLKFMQGSEGAGKKMNAIEFAGWLSDPFLWDPDYYNYIYGKLGVKNEKTFAKAAQILNLSGGQWTWDTIKVAAIKAKWERVSSCVHACVNFHFVYSTRANCQMKTWS
jgi:hypothetical protein